MHAHYTHSAALSHPPSEPPCCIECGHITVPSYLCLGCGKARYCSTNCQRKHLNTHARQCALLRARRSAQLRRLDDASKNVVLAREHLEMMTAVERSCQLVSTRGITDVMLPRLVEDIPDSSSEDDAYDWVEVD